MLTGTIQVETEAAALSFVSNEILVIRFKRGVGVEVEHADELIRTASHMVGSRIHGNLVDARALLYLSQEARESFACQEREYLTGIAVLVESALQRTMANLYLAVSRPRISTKVFTTEADAEAWIRARNAERRRAAGVAV